MFLLEIFHEEKFSVLFFWVSLKVKTCFTIMTADWNSLEEC